MLGVVDGLPFCDDGLGELGMLATAEADSLRRVILSITPLFEPCPAASCNEPASSLARLRCATRAAMTTLTLSADGTAPPKVPPNGVPVPLGVGLIGVPVP